MISFIVAVAENGVIGKGGGLPWYLPSEMALFKEKTIGHPIIMGRRTYESIGRALPGRTNIVISRSLSYKAPGCVVTDSIEKALQEAKNAKGAQEIFVIGGAAIYELAMPYADRIYLTRVKARIKGDKYFRFDESKWRQTSSQKHPKDEKNRYGYEFTTLERKKPQQRPDLPQNDILRP